MTPLWWAAAALVAPAAPAEAPSLAAWHGHWIGEGQAFGKPATATLAIAPGAGGAGGATTLTYRLTIAGEPPVIYSADATYAFDARGRLRGTWADSYGRKRPIAGGAEGATWWTHWGSADVEIGRSTYVLGEGGTLAVSDSVLQPDGGWRVFAALQYHRKSAEN
ncbi:hypothetical protein BWQ93_13965 [Sphingopyxis sp. QXT-31]|uniref:hypothetical protein n=1 Tax=Sphingopyxis sp. QXT-31 TaxID=1357916 RepID=UPI0009793353|nr:hypothetical protein [Sphingopyxis sp. QXT-31]APZ99466.1 hypothetical protein BWQ93_13965 [Sphingopyxis sp. QXT-31]